MLELPEALTLAAQLKKNVAGKTVARVFPPTKEHKFCWFNGDPKEYGASINGSVVSSAEAFGIFAELGFDNGQKLCVNDGVNVRLINAGSAPVDYQLMIAFEDGSALVFTVAMYGGIVLHGGDYLNEYYLKSRRYISPLCDEFGGYYHAVVNNSKPTLSAKALIAAEQRFPGVGNGVLQDILFNARIHPKRKLNTLDDPVRVRLLESMTSTLREMTDKGGRDTERDLFGEPGGYVTLMSKNALASGCPVCGGPITKEAYLGGSVYYCPVCQPLLK